MTREEMLKRHIVRESEIKQAATAHADAKEKAADCGTEFSTPELADAFANGAKWADEHPYWRPNVEQLEVLMRVILEERGVDPRPEGANLYFARTLESLHQDIMHHFVNPKLTERKIIETVGSARADDDDDFYETLHT
jgi:hypothetical protein